MSFAEQGERLPLYRWGREMQSYTAGQLGALLGVQDEDELCCLIERFKMAAVLRTVYRRSDGRGDEADEPWSSQLLNSCRYCFHYVGIIQNGANLLYILPKYLNEIPCDEEVTESAAREAARMRHFRQILQVIHRYQQNNKTTSEAPELSAQLQPLRVEIELLTDYVTHGVYRDDEQVDELNGNGRILWNRTMQKSLPFLTDDAPVYMELHTRRKQDDERNFFTRLHHHLAHEAYAQLEKRMLCSLLGLPYVPPSVDEISDFQDKDDVLSRLHAELAVQYDSRRRWLLELMKRYLQGQDSRTDNGILVFGKSGFHVVWEEACRSVLGMRSTETADMASSCPVWSLRGEEKPLFGACLKADMFYQDEDSLLICDAKYYTPSVSESAQELLSRMPAVGDIMKQQVYEYALNMDGKIPKENIENMFLLPVTESETELDEAEVHCIGCVRMPALRLARPVYLYKWQPTKVWECYLHRETLSPVAWRKGRSRNCLFCRKPCPEAARPGKRGGVC